MESIIREMPLGVFAVMLLLLCGMSAVALFAGLHARRRAAVVEGTPTSPIGMAADGYREFEGTVEAIGGEVLTAPLTRSPCCWYRVRVERWVSQTRSRSGGWSVVRDETSSAPFFVRDSTGVCTVRVYNAEVTPTDRSVWTGANEAPDNRNPPRLPPTGSATGIVQVAGGPDSRFRYTEERIYAGDPLLVLGDFTSGRFAASADDEDDLDEEDGRAGEVGNDDATDAGEALEGAAGEAGVSDPFDDIEVAERLSHRAWTTTKASIGAGSSGRPFLFTTTPQAAHVAMSTMGGQAATAIALGPLALAGLLLWTRLK